MIDYEIDIDESLEQACVPKLTLQPLVENAIDHGIRNTGRGGFIRISGREEDGFCVLTVRDNGAGMEQQGRKLVRAVRSRYDGERRNPWNEMECGSNYARSLASYGLLLAYSGYRCSAAEGEVTFAPLKNRNGSWFFSQDSGFGVVRYDRDRVTLRLLYGTLTLRVLQLHRPSLQEVRKNGSPLAAAVSDGRVVFHSPCVLHAGDELWIALVSGGSHTNL